MRDTLHLAEMTVPYLLAVFQDGHYLLALCLIVDVCEVAHITLIIWQFGCLCLAINYTVFGDITGPVV